MTSLQSRQPGLLSLSKVESEVVISELTIKSVNTAAEIVNVAVVCKVERIVG